MLFAVTRAVPSTIDACELTHIDRQPIDLGKARAQHAAYEAALEAAGCTLRRLPPLDALPDSVFVEDTAVVVDELAVIVRPGAASRRAETASVAEAMRAYRDVVEIAEPGTLDGGDVLQLGETIVIGLSARTNAEGARQLREFLDAYGYIVKTAEVTRCLHLKSAATRIGVGKVLINPDWIDRALFDGGVVEVDPGEPYAANALLVGDTLLCSSAYPKTNAKLGAVTELDMSELAKAEGALTCCSILFTT
ncbi:MAG TPA: arginine deiminase family protein [Thermoanaerobaculia bacterium]|nr:arginine deiminase family protein [Thermoanaerobaculia bacterium]